MKTLIKNGIIITMRNQTNPEIIIGDIGIDNNIITFVGNSHPTFKADKIIDATGSIVMPGLINAHTHIAMSLMRNYADDLPFYDWLFKSIIPVEEKLTSQLVYAGSMLSIVEMIKSGITTFADMYFFMDSVADAVINTGVRAKLSRGLTFANDTDIYKLHESKDFFKRMHNKADNRISIDIGPHAVYTCPPHYLKQTAALAQELGAGIHIHLSESQKEVSECKAQYGKSPIALAESLGLFDGLCYAAHCVHIDDEDIAILKKHKVSVVHNPSSNMKLGNGFAPISKLKQNGITVALGTDGPASNNNQNMFEEMHLAALISKGHTGDPAILSAFDTLKMATIDGAKALGLENITGSIDVNKQADIIIVNTNAPHFYPLTNYIAALVYSAQASDVNTVMCDGNIIMHDRKMTNIDEKEICNQANIAAKELLNQA